MDNSTLLRAIVADKQSSRQWSSTILDSTEFDKTILSYQSDAEAVWRHVRDRFAARDELYRIPYQFVEAPKLYAMDALVVANPLLANAQVLTRVAELFVVFYLVVHYFDDHVEHRDKFYSKFAFDQSGDIDSQRGAAPFSFMLVAFDIMAEISNELPIKAVDQLKLMAQIRHLLVSQTRFFSLEKKLNIRADEVIEIKQRQVSGRSLAVLASILAVLDDDALSDVDFASLEQALVYVGSLTQITDDIRDLNLDKALRNANIITALEEDVTALTALYEEEARLATEFLGKVYDAPAATAVLSLPFYPFLVIKRTAV